MAANNYTPHYRSQFGDTTLTKVFVGGLAWETPTDEMRNYFDQFGDILEAVIISDKNTGKSKGYGFVTFRDPESARRACLEANPVIDGRRANCNIASMGRPRPSPPRGRNQGGNNTPYQGAGAPAMAAAGSSYSGVPGPHMTPVPPPAMMYPPHYGYPSYSGEYGYPQAAMYNPVIQQQQAQYYQQYYGGASSSPGGNVPYYYGAAGGYAAPSPRGGYPTHLAAGHRMQLYYPAPQLQAAVDQQSSFSYNNPATPPTLHQPPFTRRSFSSPTDSVQITPQPATPSEAETGVGNASPEGPTS